MDPELEKIVGQLAELQNSILLLTDSTKRLVESLPAARKAAGLDYTSADKFVARLDTLGSKLKQLENKLTTFDDKELTEKVDRTLLAHYPSESVIGKSVRIR